MERNSSTWLLYKNNFLSFVTLVFHFMYTSKCLQKCIYLRLNTKNYLISSSIFTELLKFFCNRWVNEFAIHNDRNKKKLKYHRWKYKVKAKNENETKISKFNHLLKILWWPYDDHPMTDWISLFFSAII